MQKTHDSDLTGPIAVVTNSSATAERPRELGEFKGVGHFEATF